MPSDKVISTFAAFFPASDPKYVLVIALDEPVDDHQRDRRSAPPGWTAAPVAGACDPPAGAGPGHAPASRRPTTATPLLYTLAGNE